MKLKNLIFEEDSEAKKNSVTDINDKKDDVVNLDSNNDESGDDSDDDSEGNIIYDKRIQSLFVDDDILNHNHFVEKVYGDRESASRSKFRKNINGVRKKDGEQYGFLPKEINKLKKELKSFYYKLGSILNIEDE